MSLGTIDTSALLKMAYTSALAGVSVAVVFSLAILGATRRAEMRRAGRSSAALAYGALAVTALVVAGAIVVFGLALVGRKS